MPPSGTAYRMDRKPPVQRRLWLYPVQCQNVLIENCSAMGASDAGLYVGQCKT